MNKPETIGQIAIINSLPILNAIRNNMELECKEDKDPFDWRICDDSIYNMEFSINVGLNPNSLIYRETGKKIKYDTERNVDEFISALIDLYHDRKVYRRRNYKYDMKLANISLSEYNKNLKNETDQNCIELIKWEIESTESKLNLKEDNERYKWHEYSRDDLDKTGILGFAVFDYKPMVYNNYKLKELIEKRVGKIIY